MDLRPVQNGYAQGSHKCVVPLRQERMTRLTARQFLMEYPTIHNEERRP